MLGEISNREPLLRPQMPELDTIRGLAILGVLLYHGFYWARDLSLFSPWQRYFLEFMSFGQFGVNLFFVLSGFLITGILLDSQSRQDYYRRFYFRRAIRILPAYYLTLLLLVIFKLTSPGFLLMSLAYSSNMSPLFGIPLSYPVLWSLAVEEHFYLIWPMATKRIAPRKLLWILVGMMVFSPICRYLYHQHPILTKMSGPEFGSFTWNHLDGLALGAMVAILVRGREWYRKQMLRLSIVLMILAVLLTLVGYPFGILTRRTAIGEALQYVPWNFAFAAVLGCFLLIGSGPSKSFVNSRSMSFLGKISYGLYLYHLMVFTGFDWVFRQIDPKPPFDLSSWEGIWVRVIIAGTASVLVAWFSRVYFEEPFLQLKNLAYARAARTNGKNQDVAERSN